MTWFLHHAGAGYLARGSATGPICHPWNATPERYELADEFSLTPHHRAAHRFGDRAGAETLAAELNAKEKHTKWRALSETAARDMDDADAKDQAARAAKKWSTKWTKG